MKALFIISGLGILAMLAEIFKFKKLLFPLVLLGLIGAYVANFTEWNNNYSIPMFANMIRFDNVSLAFSSVLLTIAFFWFILADDYFQLQHKTDHYTLVLFALVGAIMLTAFNNMTTLFLGIEILSIPMYVLAASRKKDISSNEAGFKYLIMGSFASGFLLFGIALIYGAVGSFDLMTIRTYISQHQTELPMFFYAGILMMLVAMLFKVSAAPFHFWAPDVYEGSPTVVTALMSTMVKTAAFAAFLHLFLVVFGKVSDVWALTLSVVIALSLLVSNITAATQNNVKRMLAYSSISHAAFMLMPILANARGWLAVNSILFYSLAYSIGSITAFAVTYQLSKKHNDSGIESFNGLAKSNPLMAFCMAVSLLSLAGIPITSGFFAKYFVFTTLISTPYKWLLIIAILTSAVGVYYYFKVLIAMYFKPLPNEGEELSIDVTQKALLVITTVLTLLLGLFPKYVVEIFG